MKSIILYFSQSGNTKKIAEAVRKGMSEQITHCDIARLQDISSQDLAPYDLIGLGSPVWHRREPSNVMNFIEFTLNAVEGRHGFAFCTHGLLPGRFFARVIPAMAQRGLAVIGWNNWYCSVSMPEKPKPYFTDGHPDDIDLQQASDFGRDMALRSRKLWAGEKPPIPVLPRGSAYDELYPGSESMIRPPEADFKKWRDMRDFDLVVNPQKCAYPKCTVCVQNCPTDSINMAASPPVIRKNCDRCFFCEQICPRGAIEIDWEPVADFVNRYIIQSFSKVSETAEAKGRFRRLVPLEKVGWDSPWYKVKKPPRLKVR